MRYERYYYQCPKCKKASVWEKGYIVYPGYDEPECVTVKVSEEEFLAAKMMDRVSISICGECSEAMQIAAKHFD